MIHDIKIPRVRVRVLMKDKKRIEESTGIKIEILPEGDVHIDGNPEGCITAANIVKAIGRGFSAKTALLLLDYESQIMVIPVEGTEKTVKRLMSRVIGRSGMSKKIIERNSGAEICVYGKTVSILGKPKAVSLAATAVEDLLSGRKHAYVYKKLEKMKRLA